MPARFPKPLSFVRLKTAPFFNFQKYNNLNLYFGKPGMIKPRDIQKQPQQNGPNKESDSWLHFNQIFALVQIQTNRIQPKDTLQISRLIEPSGLPLMQKTELKVSTTNENILMNQLRSNRLKTRCNAFPKSQKRQPKNYTNYDQSEKVTHKTS